MVFYFRSDQMSISTIATYCDKLNIQEIFPDEKYQNVQARPFPFTIVMKPAVYSFAKQNYHLHKEGLYRFHLLDNKTFAVESFQQIVYKKDAVALVAGLLNCTYDRSSIKLDKSRAELLLHSSESMLDATGFEIVHFFLEEYKIPNRQIFIYSTAANVVVHKLIEFWDEGSQKWYLLDPLYGMLLKNITYQDFVQKDTDKLTNLENIEYIARIKRDNPEALQLWMDAYQYNSVNYKYFITNPYFVFLAFDRPKDSLVIDDEQYKILQEENITEIAKLPIIVKSMDTIIHTLYRLPQIYVWANAGKYAGSFL